MLAPQVTNVPFETFRAASAGKKVILLYPWSHFRNIFLSYFLLDLSEALFYFRVTEHCRDITQLGRDLLAEARQMDAAFGAGLAATLDGGSAEDMGAALAGDLDAVDRERVMLYLDELDRVAQDADFRRFITALVDNLPARAQLIVNSRLLTYEPWIHWVHRDDVAVLGAAHRSSDLMFTRETSLKPQLEVYAFGRGHALSNGREITKWDGALPRNLFFYFVDNPLVTRDQIFDIFWPKLSIRDATNVFHVTKRKITERISVNVDDGENYELTTYSTGFYVPSDKVVRHYDVADFEGAMEGALLSDDPRERERHYSHAIEMYRAPFLYPVQLPWVVARRQQLQLMYAEALIGMARLHVDREAWEGALGYYYRALREVPQREDIHRGVMTAHIQLGQPADARAQYDALERILKRQLGLKPADETQVLLSRLG